MHFAIDISRLPALAMRRLAGLAFQQSQMGFKAGFIYHVLVAATEATARDAGVGHRCSWHPDDIDKQRTSSPLAGGVPSSRRAS